MAAGGERGRAEPRGRLSAVSGRTEQFWRMERRGVVHGHMCVACRVGHDVDCVLRDRLARVCRDGVCEWWAWNVVDREPLL